MVSSAAPSPGEHPTEALPPAEHAGTILNALGEGVYGLDAAGLVTFVNRPAELMLGWPARDLIGRSIHDRVHHSYPDGSAYPEQQCPLHRTLRDGTVHQSIREVFWRRDGTSFPIRYTSTPVVSDGVIVGAVVSFEDTTERNQRERRERFLADLDRQLHALSDPDEISSATARALAEHLGADCCAYAEQDPEQDHLVVAGHHPPGTGGPTGGFAPAGIGAEGLRLMRRDLPYIVDDAEGDERVRPEDLAEYGTDGVRAVVGVPLVRHGLLVAGMAVYQGAPRPWIAAEVELVKTVARRCWESVQRARALAREHQLRERTEFLAEASRRLAGSLDQARTAEQVARLAIPRLGSLCIVDAVGGSGQVHRLAAAHTDPAQEDLAWKLERRYPVGEDPNSGIAEAIRTGLPVLVPEVSAGWIDSMAQDRGQRDILADLDLGSLITAPLIARGHILGAVTVAAGGARARYGEPDLELVEELAHRAALALDNARLYAEQAHAAHTLQQSLLPARLPEIPGMQAAVRYRPAGAGVGSHHEVGGDFYDLFPIQSGWAAVVGDVAGKGLEAAQLTALARHTLTTATLYEREPRRVLGTLNAALCNRRSGGRFCTVALGFVRPVRGGGARLTLCSGGHPPPLLLRADGTVARVHVPGKLVGVLDEPGFGQRDVHLPPGEALLLYTDGLLEARDREGDFFGEQRLDQALARGAGLDAEGIADTVERALTRFHAGALQRDDVAILVLRATPT